MLHASGAVRVRGGFNSLTQDEEKAIDDELGDGMEDSLLETLRGVNRKHFHDIWKRAQSGELQGLTDEEQHLGRIMLDHSDEYFNQFEFADALANHEYNPETGVNPFLHVTLHAVAERQVQDRSPIEAFQFYNAMLRNKCSRHEAIHLLNIILVKFIFQTLKEKVPFPLDSYRKMLKEYKSRRPEKIERLVEDIQFDERPEREEKRELDPRIERFLTKLRKRHPNIRTHEEDDDDWWREGMRMLGSGNLEGAEKRFEQLILAEPEHHDGYEGLALVCRKKGKKDQALLLIEHAVALARGFFEEGTLDQEILDEIEEEKRKILDMR
jgi:tetratricopeptide (TPR) repeat protein